MALKLGRLQQLASESLKGLILPTLALAIPMTGKYIRQVRAAVLEQLGQTYVRQPFQGIPLHTVLIRDVLRNAMLTVITLLSLTVGPFGRYRGN